jgi:hypothetical protein
LIERAESATMGGLGIGMEGVRLVAGEVVSMLSSSRQGRPSQNVLDEVERAGGSEVWALPYRFFSPTAFLTFPSPFCRINHLKSVKLRLESFNREK